MNVETIERMKLDQLLALKDVASDNYTNAVQKFLEAAGWKHTCQTPGCLWMWERTMPDGRTLLVTEELALEMQFEMEAA